MVDPSAKTAHSEIPATGYWVTEETRSFVIKAMVFRLRPVDRVVVTSLMIPQPAEGRYELLIAGTGAVRGKMVYRLVVDSSNQVSGRWTHFAGGGLIEPEVTDRYQLVYSSASTPAVEIH